MATTAQWRASHRRIMAKDGETVTLRRPGTPNIDKTVRARPMGQTRIHLGSIDVVSDAQENTRRVIVLAEDVISSGFPIPFKPSYDRIVFSDGRVSVITAVDDETGRIGGVQMAYQLEISGA